MANADINNVPRFRMPNFRSRLHDHIFYLNLIRLLSPRDGEIGHNNIYLYIYIIVIMVLVGLITGIRTLYRR